MPKRTNPADVANLFIRCFLADLGEALGGCSHVEWDETLKFFEHRCAYTGETLSRTTAVMDHAIPINKENCGLHLRGNLVPCTGDANRQKHQRHYRDFVDSPEKLERIDEWFRRTRYWKRAAVIGDLRALCSEKYATIVKLCKAGRESAFQQFGTATIDREQTDLSGRPPLSRSKSATVLPIELVSVAGKDFKGELLKRKQAWIMIVHSDGPAEFKLWTVGRLSPQSNIIRNLRSRREFRAGEWQRRGIVRVTVTLSAPPQSIN